MSVAGRRDPDCSGPASYEIEGTGDTLLVRFATKAGQQKLAWFLSGQGRYDRDAGKALVDTTTMQVVRLERNLLNLPAKFSRLVITASYGPAVIGDRQFWMPQSIRTEIAERDPKKTAVFSADYDSCKRFVGEIKIVP